MPAFLFIGVCYENPDGVTRDLPHGTHGPTAQDTSLLEPALS